MYSYEVQQIDLELLQQSSRSQYIKIELLSHDKQTILDEIQGQLLSDNFSADGESSTRRTYSATFFVNDASFFINKQSKVWIDKYIRVYYGLQANNLSIVPTYYTIGTFSFSNLTYTFNATTSTLNLNCLDMMADYDGTKGGVVPTSTWEATVAESSSLDPAEVVIFDSKLFAEKVGNIEGGYSFIYLAASAQWFYNGQPINITDYGFSISDETELIADNNVDINLQLAHAASLMIYRVDPATITDELPHGRSTSIYQAVEDTVQAAGITDYDIQDIGKFVPYDLEFNIGATWNDIWKALCDLYPDWEYFFDEYGKFIWRQIPSAYSDPRLLDAESLEDVIISETINNDYSNVYNATEIWGSVLDLSNNDRYAFFDQTDFEQELELKGFDGLDEETLGHLQNIEIGHTDLYNARMDNDIQLYLDILFGRSTEHFNLLVPTIIINNNTMEVRLPGSIETMEDFGNYGSLAIRIPGSEVYTNTLNYIKINSFDSVPIYDAAGNEIAHNTFFGGRTYVFRFRLALSGEELTPESTKFLNWYLQGSGQCFAKYVEKDNSFSSAVAYSVPNVGYEILQVKDYSNLSDDDACKEQAEYDTYKACVQHDTITLQSIIIPWLEPHQKIQYRTKMTNEISDWLIKDLSWNTASGTMNLTLYRFIEDFQYVWDRKYKN